MSRKYLDELGVYSENRPDGWNQNDKRQEQWRQERFKYGFDERETWSLDRTFYLWLYERLKYYIDHAPVNLDYHTFEFDGQIINQKQCIERMINGCAIASLKEDYEMSEDEIEQVNDVAKNWALVLPVMWW